MIEEIATEKVKIKLAEFKEALRQYKKATGKTAKFILEKDAPKIKSELLKNGKLYADRESMLLELAKGTVAAEVGVQQGIFSQFILKNTDVKVLHLFDLSRSLIRRDVIESTRTKLHIGDSSKLLSQFAENTFDWIYIDADHSYQGVKKDIDAAISVLKPDGILFFNDYIKWSVFEAIPYGVMPAVNEQINEGYNVVGFALSPHGFYDIALRKPSN